MTGEGAARAVAATRRIAVKAVVVPKNCRDIRELAWRLNPGSQVSETNI